MLSEIRFGSLLCYSPKGESELSKRSRIARDKIKNGDAATLRRFVELLRERTNVGQPLHDFFNTNTLLVPMPRSAPLVTGALWPSKRICDAMAGAGFGTTAPLLERFVAVPKSAFARPGERPTIPTHFASLRLSQLDVAGADLIVVDDIITRGNSVLAAASRLAERLPKASIRAFAVIRTRSSQEVDEIIDPVTGRVTQILDNGHREP